MESILLPEIPVEPAAPYLGGKRNLARRIIARLGTIPHRIYVEPFVGMGGIFLRRPFRAPIEVINDVSADVANLFRVLQWHYVPLMDMLRWQVTSRAEFDRLRHANPDTLTDLQRAARFLYLQRLTFGARTEKRTFGVSTSSSARFDVGKLGPALEAIHERLRGVVVERLPYGELIRRYDRPGTLFYADPPYYGCEDDYGDGVFSPEDFVRLAEQLRGIQGRFLLSINDTPEVRQIFAGFQLDEVDVSYTVSLQNDRPRARELLVSGSGGAEG